MRHVLRECSNMEKMSLKNIKLVLISIIVLVIIVLLLNLMIANSTSKVKSSKEQQQPAQEQTETDTDEDTNAEENETPSENSEYIESDDEEYPRNQRTTSDRSTSTQEYSYSEYSESTQDTASFPEKTKKTDNETKTSSSIFEQNEIKPEKKPEEKQIIVPVKEKTPQEIYNFAVLEMKKGRYNSAIYEFNNAIDVLQDANTIMSARRYLASCYEKQGINTEAFDIYESIYLETSSKSDLLQLYRLGQKTKRTFTVHSYMQEYIENHPEEQESLAGYMNY